MALLRLEHRDQTAIVVFDRPPANAFNLPLVEEFHARLDELASALPAGGMVLTGAGGVFSGGVDFKEVPAYTAEDTARAVSHINASVTALYGLPTSTVAAVNGHAIGGAFVVMLACDARIAARTDFKMGLTEVSAGIPYPACPMEVVKAEIEPSYRRHLAMSGEIIGPRDALEHGLIDDIVEPDDLVERAVELARRRVAAPSYVQVKHQLKGEILERMTRIVANGSDPLLTSWV